MRHKRLISIFLLLILLSTFLPASAAPPTTQAPLPSIYRKATVGVTDNVAVKQGSGAWKVAFDITTKADAAKIIVAVQRADYFDKMFNADFSKLSRVTAQNYDEGFLNDVTSAEWTAFGFTKDQFKSYYRAGETPSPSAGTVTIELALNGSNYPAVNESSTSYHSLYRFMVLDSAGDFTESVRYGLGSFRIDSEGHVQTESYMVRYMGNKYPTTGGSNPVISTSLYQIEGWGTDAAVNTTSNLPSRTGFTFLGWDSDKNKAASDPNTAALSPATPEYPKDAAGADAALSWSGKVHPAFKNANYDPGKDQFYNLYAVWKPNKVQYEASTQDTIQKATLKDGTEVPMIKLDSPQVGVNYQRTGKLAGTTDGATDKVYQYLAAQEVTLPDNSKVTTQDFYAKYTLTVSQSNRTTFQVAGNPKSHSSGAHVYALVQVTDKSNGTTDLALIWFDEVQKGAQLVPTVDANTGLQARMKSETTTVPTTKKELQWVEAGEGETGTHNRIDNGDGTYEYIEAENGSYLQKEVEVPGEPEEETVLTGQIYGFYSSGPNVQDETSGYTDEVSGYKDSKGNAVTNEYGVGTMAKYYILNDRVYEYRPSVVTVYDDSGAATQVTLVDEEKGINCYETETAGCEQYFGLPNKGYREVPTVRGFYSAGDELLDAAMAAGSNQVLTTTKSVAGNSYTAAVSTPEGFTGWPAAYGSIAFEDSERSNSAGVHPQLPYVTGLEMNDEYQIRFRGTNEYSPSAPVTIKIGGSVSGGSSGPADPSDFASIVFYDWDDTLLGAIVVPKGADVSKHVQDFEQSKMAPTSKAVDAGQEKYYVASEEYPLTNKEGYTFSCWLDNTSDTLTHYGRNITAGNVLMNGEGTNPAPIPRPMEEDGVIDFSKGITENTVVKACYGDNDELKYETSAARMQYTTEVTALDYGRLATSVTYSITIHVYRGNVPRMGDPVLKLQYSTSGGTVYLYESLKNTDDATFTFYPTTSVSSVQCNVVDNWEISSVGAARNKSPNLVIEQGSNGKDDGFLYRGSYGGLCKAIELNDPSLVNNALIRTQVGLSTTKSAADVVKILRTAWETKNSVGGVLKPENQWVRLSPTEMQAALGS